MYQMQNANCKQLYEDLGIQMHLGMKAGKKGKKKLALRYDKTVMYHMFIGKIGLQLCNQI